MIDISNIRIIRNYVLVKPDENYTEIQYKGKNTGIASSDFMYDKNGKRVNIGEKNYSVTGTVYAVPDKLEYRKDKANALGSPRDLVVKTQYGDFIKDKSLMAQINHNLMLTLDYKTSMELCKGDRVRFSYMAHKDAMDKGAVIDTKHGKMYFIRYDYIFMSIHEDMTPKKMINGYVLAAPKLKKTKTENGVTFAESDSSIFIPVMGDRGKENRARKNMIGTVILAGTPLEAYKQMDGIKDFEENIDPGTDIIFDPRASKRLEQYNHQHFEEDLYLLHRRQICFLSEKNPNFGKISVEKKL